MSSTVLENIKALNKCHQSFKNGEYGNLTQAQFETRMKSRFESFNQKYPMIFEKSVKGFFQNKDEINRLKQAISTQNDINSGKITEKEGGVIFGQMLVDTFVKPKLGITEENPEGNPQHNTQSESQSESQAKPEATTPIPQPSSGLQVEVDPEPEPQIDSDEEFDDEDNTSSTGVQGLLNNIVMPTHEIGSGDIKRKIMIDSDDEDE